MNGDAIKPSLPNFELKIDGKLGAISVSITFYGIGDKKWKKILMEWSSVRNILQEI
jgi:hypothetical protein